MDISVLHNQLRSGEVDNLYIFTGQEWMLQKIYIQQIAKVESVPVKYVDSVKDIYAGLSSSLFGGRFVYVVRDDKDIQVNEKLQNQLKQGLLRNSILIYLWTNPDKRKKFYKDFEDHIVQFDSLKPEILKKYLRKEIEMSDSSLNKLMEVCEYDYGRCLLEIDKIKRYSIGMNYTIDDHVYNHVLRELLDDGTIYQPPKDAIFDFVSAVLDRRIEMFDYLDQSYAVGEATMVLLSVLYTNTKQVLQVQSCHSKDISKSTGLTPWQIKCAKEHVGEWSNQELIHLMRIIQKVEKGIKTGQFDEENAVEYVLINAL